MLCQLEWCHGSDLVEFLSQSLVWRIRTDRIKTKEGIRNEIRDTWVSGLECLFTEHLLIIDPFSYETTIAVEGVTADGRALGRSLWVAVDLPPEWEDAEEEADGQDSMQGAHDTPDHNEL